MDKCEMCGHETPELETKKVQVEVGCCSQCALEWDAVKLIEKDERKRTLREASYRWADGLHGRRVVVYWDCNTHPVQITHYERCMRGIAYRTANECGGWGSVQVVIDPAEHHRISLQWVHRIEYGTGKHLPYQKPIVDGQEYGLYLNLGGNGSYYTLVSWGCRKSLDLVESNENNKQATGAG